MSNDFYTKDGYIENVPSYHVEHSPWKVKQIYKIISRNNLEINRICDIGCGAGEVLAQLQKLLPDDTLLDGYDISPGAIKLCKKRQNNNLKYYCEDLLHKEVEEYDLLLCIDVFEHVEDYMGFLRIIRNKSIYKIFHIPIALCVPAILLSKSLLRSRKKVGHLHYFMRETALATLEDSGYEIIDWFYTDRALEFADNPRTRFINIFRRCVAIFNKDLSSRIFGGYSLLVLTK